MLQSERSLRRSMGGHQYPILEALSRKQDEPILTPRILLVDDSEDIRLALTSVLEQNNFDVVTAANVPDALRRIATETFDVLLSDLHMPLSPTSPHRRAK